MCFPLSIRGASLIAEAGSGPFGGQKGDRYWNDFPHTVSYVGCWPHAAKRRKPKPPGKENKPAEISATSPTGTAGFSLVLTQPEYPTSLGAPKEWRLNSLHLASHYLPETSTKKRASGSFGTGKPVQLSMLILSCLPSPLITSSLNLSPTHSYAQLSALALIDGSQISSSPALGVRQLALSQSLIPSYLPLFYALPLKQHQGCSLHSFRWDFQGGFPRSAGQKLYNHRQAEEAVTGFESGFFFQLFITPLFPWCEETEQTQPRVYLCPLIP